MNLSLALAFLWLIAANVIGMVPSKKKHWPQAYVLIVIGLLTRFAALGMIGFVVVQSLTDLYGHGGIAHAETLGAWFDGLPTGAILDQRAFWMVVFVTLVLKGAGPLSVDRLLRR